MAEFPPVEDLGVVFEVSDSSGDQLGFTFPAELGRISSTCRASHRRTVAPLVAEASCLFVPDLISQVGKDPIDRFGGNKDPGLPCGSE